MTLRIAGAATALADAVGPAVRMLSAVVASTCGKGGVEAETEEAAEGAVVT